MADEDKNEAMPKHQGMNRFWSFIKSKRKDFSRIQSLRENGKTIKDSKEMADVLNRQFESVFQHENKLPTGLLPSPSSFPSMNTIDITVTGVCKMLERLKPH